MISVELNLSPMRFFLLLNDCDHGNLETLILSTLHRDHVALDRCFEKYSNCLSQLGKFYRKLNDKQRIYAYRNALRIATKPKYRDYNDSKAWNLDAPQLDRIKGFLIEICGPRC